MTGAERHLETRRGEETDLPARRPLLRITGTDRWPGFGLLETWGFHGLLTAFAAREMKLRYRQTALGVSWFVLQPLIVAATFAFVFGSVARMPSERVPRLVFTLAGVLAWTLFNSIVVRGSSAIVTNATLISKVYFPRELLPLSTVLPALLDLVVGLGLFAVLAIVFRTFGGAPIVLLPVWALLVCLLGAGLALVTSALTVWYRDLLYVVQLAMQVLMFASPLAYSLDNVPHRFRLLVAVNPLAPLLEGFRWSLLGTSPVAAGALAYAVAAALVLFFGGLGLFRVLERRFADVI